MSKRQLAPPLQICGNHLGGVVTRRAGDAAARMRAGAAHIKPGNGTAIVRMAQHRARREQSDRGSARRGRCRRRSGRTSRSRSSGLMICRAEHRGLEVRRIGVDRLDHQVGDLLRGGRPTSGRSAARGATCWQNRLATCWPCGARLSSSVEGISISTIGSLRPAVRARIEIGAVHVGERRRDDDAGRVMIGRLACRAGTVKLGSSDSATFMRNVPEPQRHLLDALRGSRAAAAS